METSFMDRIQWSQRTYALRMLLEFRRPPCIVHVPEGNRGSNEVENIQQGLVARIHSVFAERRVFARAVDGRVFSIPESFPIKFEVVKKSGKKGKARRLDEILRNYRPPILVALDRKNSKWNFRNGRMIQTEDSLGTLILFKAYFEHFARANQLINGVIDRRIFLIPLYLDLDVRLAEGYKNRNSSDYVILMKMLEGAVQSLEYNSYTGLNAILVFDPSIGSLHPLAMSRLHSRTNSTPGENFPSDVRTLTDEHTETVKSSLPSAGSKDRSRNREPLSNRKRAKSEDFLGTLLVEQTDSRTPETDSKVRHRSSDESIFGGSSAGPGDSTRGTGSMTLNRRKGRSAEELQTRSVRSEAVQRMTASTSLDPVNEDSYARKHRDRKSKNRTSGSVDQLNYVQQGGRAIRKDDVIRTEAKNARNGHSPKPEDPGRSKRSRRQGQLAQGQTVQGHSLDRVFDETVTVSSIQSRSKVTDLTFDHDYPSSGSRPLPKPRGSRTRDRSEDSYTGESRTHNRSEDSYIPAPRTRKRPEDSHISAPRTRKRSEDSYIPESRTHKRPEGHHHSDPHHSKQSSSSAPGDHHHRDTHHPQNTPQATPASPHPNYHIHINIQSPQTPPAQQWPGPQNVHSLARSTDVHPPSPPPPPTPPPSPPKFNDGYAGESLPFGAGTLHLGSGTAIRSTHHVPTGTADGSRRTAPAKIRGEPHGRSGRRQVVSEGTVPLVHTTKWNNTSSRNKVVHDVGPQTFRDKSSERRRGSGRAFVTSVSCPGVTGFTDQEPTANRPTIEGQRSTRLSSKVIQLEDSREPKISDREIKDIYGRQSTNANNHHHHNFRPLPEIPDANNNFANFNIGSTINTKYQYGLVNPSIKDRDPVVVVTNGPVRTRAATSIDIPGTRHDMRRHDMSDLRFKASLNHEDQRQEGRETQRVGRRWIIRNHSNQQPTRSLIDASIIRRNPVGTTIAVE